LARAELANPHLAPFRIVRELFCPMCSTLLDAAPYGAGSVKLPQHGHVSTGECPASSSILCI
jgi:hypothetical protein